MKIKKYFVAGLLALPLLMANTSCGANNFRDVEGVPSKDADKYEVYNNVDQNPNLTLVCIHGVAFITTTREGAASWRQIPDLNKVCSGGG